jgi:hypothetical protein
MTPEHEEQVRRALAAVAEEDRDPRMPPDVAARLDDVLAELAAPRRGAPAAPDPAATAHVHRLAARRRHAHRLLVAAAVAVIALAGGAVVVRGIEGSGSGTSSSSRAGSAAEDGGGRSASTAEPRLRSATLARDVRRVLGDPSAAPTRARLAPEPSAGGTGGTGGTGGAGGLEGGGCALPATAPGSLVTRVRLDGRSAVLVVAPAGTGARTGTRVARVLSCADGSLLARTAVRGR